MRNHQQINVLRSAHVCRVYQKVLSFGFPGALREAPLANLISLSRGGRSSPTLDASSLHSARLFVGGTSTEVSWTMWHHGTGRVGWTTKKQQNKPANMVGLQGSTGLVLTHSQVLAVVSASASTKNKITTSKSVQWDGCSTPPSNIQATSFDLT